VQALLRHNHGWRMGHRACSLLLRLTAITLNKILLLSRDKHTDELPGFVPYQTLSALIEERKRW
jgi:hypothetical protein